MIKDIYSQEFWKDRILAAPDNAKHHSIFICPADRWKRIEDKHKEILAKIISANHSILDAGCGWGRLLGLLPSNWGGGYLGVDISTDFIQVAKQDYPGRWFIVGNINNLIILGNKEYDIGILISIRPMIKRHLGNEEWDKVEKELRRVCRQLLYLEYDERDEGMLE